MDLFQNENFILNQIKQMKQVGKQFRIEGLFWKTHIYRREQKKSNHPSSKALQ